MSCGDYPMGARYDSRAPYNQECLPAIEIDAEVEITLTIRRRVKLKVDDYSINKDDFEKCIEYCFDDCDLEAAAKEQVDIPDFSDWDVGNDMEYYVTHL